MNKLLRGTLLLLAIAHLGGTPSPVASEQQLSSEASPQTTRPNILVIMTDDLSLSVLQASLSNGFMPNLQDEIITPGITFSNNFVSYSLCCPSRGTFWTGQYTHNHLVWKNEPRGSDGMPGGVTAFDDSKSLATWLRAAGYRTGFVGKWFNGYGAELVEDSNKDDSTYVPFGWDDWQAYLQPGQSTAEGGGMFDYRINDNETVIQYGHADGDYLTDVESTRAVEFLQETEDNDAQPWFLFLGTFAPHYDQLPTCNMNYGKLGRVHPAPRHVGHASGVPLPQPPNFNEEDIGTCPPSGFCTDKPRWLVNNYPRFMPGPMSCLITFFHDQMESMKAVDDAIGAIMTQLKLELPGGNELSNTVIIFTSDNGLVNGEHRYNKKQVPWDEAIRVPLYVRAPGYAAGTSSRMTMNTDLAPTIVEFAQATADRVMDGRSLVPLLANRTLTPWRHQGLLWSQIDPNSGYVGIRTDSLAVSTPNETYVEHATAGVVTDKEFYENNADPYQLVSLHNCTDEPCATRRDTLATLLQQLKTCAGATCRTLEDQ